jgi:hypothetical protein
MGNKKELTCIDRNKNIFPCYLEDEFKPEEYEEYLEVRDEIWNKIIVDEINEIILGLYGSDEEYREALMTYQTSPVKIAKEWNNSRTSIRFYKGKFYHLTFGSGMDLFDMLKFTRWNPEEFATQAERWIAGDRLVIKEEKRKSFIYGLTIGLFLTLIVSLTIIYGTN